MQSPAADLSRRLAENVEAVCRHYLPNGARSGNYWTVGDTANTRGRSLYVRLKGPLSGKGARGNWTDAATGDHGDLLDLIAARENFGSLRDTLDEARRFLSSPGSEPQERNNERAADHDTIAAARKIWAASEPIKGTPAEAYLRRRGIAFDLASMPLRYHHALFYRERRGCPSCKLPALVAAVTDHDGRIMGVHRTWLDASRSDKARILSPRRSLGTILGNGVRFGTIANVALVGEGIETVLSLKYALPSLPMIAALSAGHLAAWDMPPSLHHLIIARDGDLAGFEAARRLEERAYVRGVAAASIDPLRSDFNADLQRLGGEAFRQRVVGIIGSEITARFVEEHERESAGAG